MTPKGISKAGRAASCGTRIGALDLRIMGVEVAVITLSIALRSFQIRVDEGLAARSQGRDHSIECESKEREADDNKQQH